MAIWPTLLKKMQCEVVGSNHPGLTLSLTQLPCARHPGGGRRAGGSVQREPGIALGRVRVVNSALGGLGSTRGWCCGIKACLGWAYLQQVRGIQHPLHISPRAGEPEPESQGRVLGGHPPVLNLYLPMPGSEGCGNHEQDFRWPNDHMCETVLEARLVRWVWNSVCG